MKLTLARLGLAALIVGALAGCGGGSDSSSTSSTTPPPTTPPPTCGAGGTCVTDVAAALPAPLPGASLTVDCTNGATLFPQMTPVITVGGTGVQSNKLVVAFSLGDANGNAYAGFDKITSKSATATVASYPNFAFSVARLVPGTNGSPAKWVSYIVTTVPSTTTAAAPTRPSTDNTGTLQYIGQGRYQYNFYRDVFNMKAQVDAMTVAAPNNKADLGNLAFDSNALHRITIQFAGNAPCTGTNTPTGANSGVTAVPLKNPLNVVYDFIPATNNAVAPTDITVAQRLIVDRLSCNECHAKLGGIPGTESATFHGGSRYDPKYCVVCHTDQRKYGRTNVASTNYAFPPITYDANGNITSPATYIADGVTVGDFPVLIHRVHKGEELIKQNYNFGGVLLNETKFPQDLRNCTKCHDNTAPKVAPQATNFQMVPSRLACGACHDGIDYATGQGKTNNGKLIGHIGGIQTDDSRCALCHDKDSIKSVYHVPVTPPNHANALEVAGGSANTNAAWVASNLDNLPAGAIKVDYDILSVSRNALMQPVIVFRMLQNGVATPFNTPSPTGEIWNGFFGAPSVYFVWAVPQDGITAPADFNASASSWLKNLWNGTATGTAAGTLSAPDANGYYTVTLTGVQVPDSAVMLSGGLGYSYSLSSNNTTGGNPPLTQIGVSEYIASNNAVPSTTPQVTPRFGVSQSLIFPANPNARVGGLIVVVPDKQLVASAGAAAGGTGGAYTGRRPIVEDAKCNNCHKELGLFTAEAFHAGQRNDGSTCAWCHNPNRTSSGWSADSAYYIHAIHAGDKREKPFTWHAAAVGKSFADIGFPGILSKCETCHVPGSYDFSAPASANALPNRLYRTVGTGTFSTIPGSVAEYSLSPYITQGVNYGSGFSYNAGTNTTTPAATTTLVNSPIATACFSCHDSDLAKQHMENEGASIYRDRATALARTEQCMFCHDPASAYGLGIKAVHAK
jgi:OmcA/MtrC family decaheme c-type cytochrome